MNRPEVQGTSAVQPHRRYTVEDYQRWTGDERWELIHGVPFCMSPAPRLPHQRIVGDLYTVIRAHLADSPCEPFVSPIDLYLPLQNETGQEDTVVQPDIAVVCDPAKLHEGGIRGAPDLVIEVLSDSTAYRDLNEKKHLYEQTGVREYWVINPDDGSVLQWVLENSGFAPAREYRSGERVVCRVFEGFTWTATAGTRPSDSAASPAGAF